MEMRKCSKCGEVKSVDNFHKDRSKKSGYKSQCKECLATEERREYGKTYRLAHMDYFREKHAEYRSRNREKLQEDNRIRYANNPEKARQYYVDNRAKISTRQKEYNRSEHGKSVRSAYQQTERARANKIVNRVRRRSAAVIGDKDITLEALYNRSGGVCALCGGRCDFEDYIYRGETIIVGNNYPSIDHIVPISKGGSHTWDNVQLAHKRCNSIKSNKTV